MDPTTHASASDDSRTSIVTRRGKTKGTEVFRDRLPALSDGEIRLAIDSVGLSTNNAFYAQMADVPFLRFGAVYPVPGRTDVMHVPAWGIGTVIASRSPDVAVGERFRGFLHFANRVQMRPRKTDDGFVADDAHRRNQIRAYRSYVKVDAGSDSPFAATGAKADLAVSAAPSVLSGYILSELLTSRRFYGGDSVVLTSASSKISLATAILLADARTRGEIGAIVGYTGRANLDFVRSTGIYDRVLTYDEPLPDGIAARPVLVDVAGDAAVFRRDESRFVKALAVGGTHASAAASTFTAFRPSGLLKLAAGLSGSERFGAWAERSLSPKLEMFFAPTVMNELVATHGKVGFGRRCDDALRAFVDRLVDPGLIRVRRCETPEAAQDAYREVFAGKVGADEAILVALR